MELWPRLNSVAGEPPLVRVAYTFVALDQCQLIALTATSSRLSRSWSACRLRPARDRWAWKQTWKVRSACLPLRLRLCAPRPIQSDRRLVRDAKFGVSDALAHRAIATEAEVSEALQAFAAAARRLGKLRIGLHLKVKRKPCCGNDTHANSEIRQYEAHRFLPKTQNMARLSHVFRPAARNPEL